MLQLRTGRVAEAQVQLSEALRRHKLCLGTTHPYIARSLLGMGQGFLALQEHGQARQYISSALAMYEQYFGPAHPFTANAGHILHTSN